MTSTAPAPATTYSGLPDTVSLLLIENDLVDEMALLRTVAKLELPYQVTTTHSVAEARSILAVHNFDVILADFNLSDGNSFSLADMFADQVVIFVTGSGNEQIAARALRLGVSDYLIKDNQRNYLKLLPSRIEIALRQKRLIQQLHESEAQLRDLFDSTSDLIHSIAPDGRILFVNRAWREVLGYAAEEVAALNIFDVIHPDYHEYCRTCLQQHLAGEGDKIVETAFQTRDGDTVAMEGNVTVRFEGGQPVAVRGIFRDVTQRLHAEEDMRKLSVALEQTADAVMITDRKGIVEYVNPAFTQLTGYERREMLGNTPNILKSGKQSETFYRRLWDSILKGEVFRDILLNKRKDGTLYYEAKTITPQKNHLGNVTHFISTSKDITGQMQDQERMQYLAHHDALTDLPNRALLKDRLRRALIHGVRYKSYGAILFLDLDNFKIINDTRGHDAGDLLLIDVARRLQDCVRRGDTVARLGGDEFVILLENLSTDALQVATQTRDIAEKILLAVNQPYKFEGFEHQVSCSIGIRLFQDGVTSTDDLLKQADIAMYQAKTSGRNALHFFDSTAGIAEAH